MMCVVDVLCGETATGIKKKTGEVEANWTVRNASNPLQHNSYEEDTSGRLIMQMPRVHWPLQP